jgi:hypothetical protein
MSGSPPPSSKLESAVTTPQKENVQETLNRLEKEYVEKIQLVSNLKDQLSVAQENVFKALQAFTSVKEQYLISVVQSLQNQVKELNVPVQLSKKVEADDEDSIEEPVTPVAKHRKHRRNTERSDNL